MWIFLSPELEHLSPQIVSIRLVQNNVHCGNNEPQKTCTYGIDWLVDRLH